MTKKEFIKKFGLNDYYEVLNLIDYKNQNLEKIKIFLKNKKDLTKA